MQKFGQQGKVGLSFPLTVIGILIGAIGIALVAVTTNPIVEIISGII